RNRACHRADRTCHVASSAIAHVAADFVADIAAAHVTEIGLLTFDLDFLDFGNLAFLDRPGLARLVARIHVARRAADAAAHDQRTAQYDQDEPRHGGNPGCEMPNHYQTLELGMR